MPQTAAVVAAKAVCTDVFHVRCDVAPSCDTGPCTPDQQEHDLWLRGKEQELARLQQQQIVTNTEIKVKTLQQQLQNPFTQRLAVQSQCGSAVHCSVGADDNVVQKEQQCVGQTSCGKPYGPYPVESSSSDVANSPSESSDSPTESSSSSTAGEATLTAESEDSTDGSTASAESHLCSRADSQLDCSEHHAEERVLQGAFDPLQQAAAAAAAAADAALAGLTSTQASSRPSSSSETKPAPRCGNSWRSRRQPAATGTAAAAPPPFNVPCNSYSSIYNEWPRSSCTVSSSKLASRTMAPSRNGDNGRADGRSSNIRRPGRRRASTAAAAVGSADGADFYPSGFGAAVQQHHQGGRRLQQPQPAVPPPPLQPAAAGPIRPLLGSTAAVNAPPGFGGMTGMDSCYIHQVHSIHHRPSTASGNERVLGGEGARSSRNTRPKAAGPSRLFQGALAGAMAECK